MKNDSNLPQRSSIRLQGYDYTQPGAYFVTLCTQGREALFGEIVNGEMRLSAAGRIAAAEWRRLERQFPGIRVGAFMVMPNHVHGIIVIQDVGATRRGPINTPVDEAGSPGETQTNDPWRGTGDRPPRAAGEDTSRAIVDDTPQATVEDPSRPTDNETPRATLDNENETISGANMGQRDTRNDQYGSPLHDAYPVGATRRGQDEARRGEGGSPGETRTNDPRRATGDRPPRAAGNEPSRAIVDETPRATVEDPSRPTDNDTPRATLDGKNESMTRQGTGQRDTRNDRDGSPLHKDRPNGPAVGSLGAVIGQFKSRVTRRIWAIAEYERAPVWQRNYYEHIIRNEAEWGMIADYIENNPRRWEADQLNPTAPENPFNQGKTHGE